MSDPLVRATGGRHACAVAIRVVVGEDSFIVREGLRQVLAGAPQIQVEAECGDADDCCARSRRAGPTWS